MKKNRIIAFSVAIFILIVGALFLFLSPRGESTASKALSIVSPTPGQTIQGSFTPQIDLKDTSNIEKVTYYIDNTFVSASYTPPYTATIDTTSFENGDHSLEIKAYYTNQATPFVTTSISFVVHNEKSAGVSQNSDTSVPEAAAAQSPTQHTLVINKGKTVTTSQSIPSSPQETSSNPTTNEPTGDTTAPNAPVNVQLEAQQSPLAVSVAWQPSPVGQEDDIAHYTLLRNGVVMTVVDPTTLTYTDTDVQPGVTYYYSLQASDTTGNVSDRSSNVSITLPGVTFFPSTDPVLYTSNTDQGSIELGVNFTPKVDGDITGVRFFKPAGATGTHIGSLYAQATGTPLGQATFTNETASGWQTVTFSHPVPVTAGTNYVATYYSQVTDYAATTHYFDTPPPVNPYLNFFQSDGTHVNGVYGSSATPVMPQNTFNGANYWVDVTFSPQPTHVAVAVSDIPSIPWEGGPSYYASYAKAKAQGWTNPSHFPIGVWFESVLSQNDVDLDKAAGLNTYVQLTQDSDANLITSNGMSTIAGVITNDTAQAPERVGWMVEDEPDINYGAGNDPWNGSFGPGTCIPTQDQGGKCGYTELSALLLQLPSNDGRMRYVNFGKNALMINSGGGNQFVNNYTDATSADMYYYTDPNLCDEALHFLNIPTDQCRVAANYGMTVDQMRQLDSLDGVRQPIYGFVEVGHPFTDPNAPTITGPQIEGAVMNSLIHDARGIIYFNHNFSGPCTSNHDLRDACGAAVRPNVTAVNQKINDLAPVLNTQSLEYSFNNSLDTMMKKYNGSYYIFAMTKRGVSAGSYTFTLPVGLSSANVQVLYEGRSLPITSGTFSDSFSNESAYHIYKITP